MQGTQCGTRSRYSRITPWAEGRHSTAEAPRRPLFLSPDSRAAVLDLAFDPGMGMLRISRGALGFSLSLLLEQKSGAISPFYRVEGEVQR